VAAYGWGKDRSVDEWLYEEGYRFDFFQAVKLLELSQPSDAAVGEGAEPSREPVRFKSAVGLSFPASDVVEITPARGAERPVPEMTVSFMGLAGALGPLDAPTTEHIIERDSRKDTALRAFLDIFNHRLVSLLYRIRKVHRVGQDGAAPGSDRLAAYLYAAFGLGTPGLRRRMQVKDRALAFYAGLLGQQPRSAAGLERLLGHYFGVAVSVRQFDGRWFPLDEDQRTAIGTTGRNARLGVDAVVGSRVWDQHGGIELRLGPLTRAEFSDFLPSGWAFAPLCDLVRFYVGDELDFRVRLTLRAEEAPGARLGARGSRLGWTSWLKRPDVPEDDPEVTVSLDSLGAFAGAVRLPYYGLVELVSRMKRRTYEKHRVVVPQGEAGNSMYVIRRGEARITRRELDGSETIVSTLREGDSFGRLAVLKRKPHWASLVTLSDCTILELTRADLEEFMALHPRFADALLDPAGDKRKP
jgi:type VI secretion system protein ImpH